MNSRPAAGRMSRDEEGPAAPNHPRGQAGRPTTHQHTNPEETTMSNPVARIVADLHETANLLKSSGLDSLPMSAQVTFVATDGEASSELVYRLAGLLDLAVHSYSDDDEDGRTHYQVARDADPLRRFRNGVQVVVQSSSVPEPATAAA